MKNMKKLLMTGMMLILAFSFSSVVSAAPQYDKVRTYYEDIGKNGKVIQDGGGYTLWISNVPDGQAITSVKSSNTKVVKLNMHYKDKYDPVWYIDLVLRRQGSAKISFKLGGQRYETKVNVKKYKNPIKYISMTGVKYGKKKNLASSTDKWMTSEKLDLTKTTKRPELKIAAKKGWKIKRLYTESGEDELKRPRSKIVKRLPYTLRKGKANIAVQLINTKDNGELILTYACDDL